MALTHSTYRDYGIQKRTYCLTTLSLTFYNLKVNKFIKNIDCCLNQWYNKNTKWSQIGYL